MTVIADEHVTQMRTPIQEFYAEQNVFITGGTGFLGKILIQKLLRSCPELSTIYLLIRPKKGKDVHNRLDDIFDDPLFALLKTEQPKYRHKIVVVSGDCSLPNLGLSIEDRELLIRKASIVFNVAATVRFDEKLKFAVAINVTGTREVMDICRSMYNLKAVIHVSTAYSNCNLSIIEEKFYPPPISGESIERLTESLDETKLNEITSTLLGDFPNTYAYTKAIAENTAKENGKDLPLGIFRPAMVISTCFEPVEGWIDNVFGPTGAIVGAGAGLIRTLNIDSKCFAELIPVDLTVNALIATAWDVANNKGEKRYCNIQEWALVKSNGPYSVLSFMTLCFVSTAIYQPPIYNYVASWKSQGITWGEYSDYALKYGIQYPNTRSIWCYVNYATKYTMLYNILTIILHIIPALILDTGLILTGQSPKLIKIYKKIHKFAAVTSYFTQRTWKFHNDNTRALWDKLVPTDREAFFFSMEHFDWDSYMQKYIRGLRMYIFKEELSSVPVARKRMARMKVIHNIIICTILGICLWSSYKLVSFAMSFGQTAEATSINENIISAR